MSRPRTWYRGSSQTRWWAGAHPEGGPGEGAVPELSARAVHNYAISARRGERACQPLNLDEEDRHAGGDPEAEFNRAWADSLLQEVLKELEIECSRRDKLTHWGVFHDWLLDQKVGQDQATMEQICRKYSIPDAAKAYHMIENVKRRFRSILRDHLSQYAGSDTEIEAEIREFISVFSSSSARI